MELIERARPREVVSLEQLRSEIEQGVCFRLGLDTLADELHSELLANLDQGGDQHSLRRALIGALYETHVDLGEVGVEPNQIGQCRVTRSQVVHREEKSQRSQGRDQAAPAP